MSLKDLFVDKKKNSAKSIVKKSLEDVSREGGDSDLNVKEFFKRRDHYEPLVDYATASNFAKYGSAEEYYDSAIKKIYQDYPYDGSSYEKNKWFNEGSGLDRYVFEKEYPRTNGYALFSPTGFGSIRGLVGGVYSKPASQEYIFLKGGPNLDNIWNTGSSQSSNLEINGSSGNTVEFWLKKDAFSNNHPREVIFDNWRSGSVEGLDYGRFTIELDKVNKDAGNSPFLITYKSGSSGFNQKVIGSSDVALSASDGNWHHYAITLRSDSDANKTSVKMYVDGNINDIKTFTGTVGSINRSLVATIGALAAAKSTTAGASDPSYLTNRNLGFGKLSGSIDEFRFWKEERSSKEIGTNWFTQVHGGANTKHGESTLGVYYKFNEGISSYNHLDTTVLDYSGRITNGVWYGYSERSRSTKSAIIQSSASLSEFKDPILYLENPKLSSYAAQKKDLGREHDINNSTCIYYSIPSWILEEEEFSGNVKFLSQIMGSYFDTLYLQIQDLSTLKHARREDFKNKPIPFMKKLIKSFGLNVPELFVDTDIVTLISNKSNEINYEQKLDDVKNFIYTNLYNNLTNIYKMKGTESSFRNLMRCYGIDEKLVRLKMYADNVSYEAKNEFVSITLKDKIIDFTKERNQGGIIFQQSSSFSDKSESGFKSYNYVTGTHDSVVNNSMATTTEMNVVFPATLPSHSEHRIPRPLSSSLFGAVTDSDSSNINGFKAPLKDHGGFEVYAVKNTETSPHAKFVLISRSGLIPHMETKFIENVYSDSMWNISVRVAPERFGSFVSGAISVPYKVEFYGVNSIGDSIDQRFEISKPITHTNALKFHKLSKRFYLGARRNNFTGSIAKKTDIKASSFKHWLSRLENKDLDNHLLEVKSIGVSDPLKVVDSTFGKDTAPFRKIDSLAIHWEFDNVTGSNTAGRFIVDDISSGSSPTARNTLASIASSYHPGRGHGFSVSSDSFVKNNFVATNKKVNLGEVRSSDMIMVSRAEKDLFQDPVRPSDYYFSFEKSLYATISEEMMDMFSSITEYSALVGNPVNRYRANYKNLDKLREMFFAKVQNTPSVERFLEFYKWIDQSVDEVLDQFVPATSNFSEDIRNVVESHSFERAKYRSQFPTIEGKIAEPIASLTGINELRYDWKSGHAPFAAGLAGKNAEATITVDLSQLSNPGNQSGHAFAIVDSFGNCTQYVRHVNQSGIQLRYEGPEDRAPNGSLRQINIDMEGGAITTEYGIALKLQEAINSELTNAKITAAAPSPGAGQPNSPQTIKVIQDDPGQEGNVANPILLRGPFGANKFDMTVNQFSITDFTGGQGHRDPQSIGCLWWNDRIERTDSLVSTGDIKVDRVRETLRKRINSVVSGSSYKERRLTRPYKLSSDFQVPIHGGDNFNLNKSKDFFMGTTRPLSVDFIQVSSSGTGNQSDRICNEVRPSDAGGGVPRSLLYYESKGMGLKTKQKIHLGATVSNGEGYKANHIVPFSFYSSSAPAFLDYKFLIKERFRDNVDITNLHSDSYGDDREIPMQGPFTQHFIGGHFHRHVPLNRSGSFGISSGRKQKVLGAHKPARATLTTAGNGNAVHGLTAGQRITITSAHGTKVDYFVSDTGDGGADHLAAVTNGTVLKLNGDEADTTATLSAGATRAIAVGFDLSESRKQNTFLSLLKAAIEHARGHNGEIKVSANPVTRGVPQSRILEQTKHGSSGVTTITEDLATITKTDFTITHPDGQYSGLDAEGDRREGFFIRMNDEQLYVVNPDAQLTSSAEGSSYRYFVPKPEASANSLVVLREPLAKRPVNIRNIQTTTSSLAQGNFQRDYEIVQGTSIEINKDWLVDNHANKYKVDEVQDPDAKATATIRVTDGDANHGLSVGQKITLTSTDGTKVDYFISNINRGGRGHLGDVTQGATLDSVGPVTADLTPGAKGIAVGYNVPSADSKNQRDVLVLLKAAIEHANGHNGKIIVSSVPDAADGNQDITLTQRDPGHKGNTVSTEDLPTISVHSDFSGGGGLTNISFGLNHEFNSEYFRGRKHTVRPNRKTGKKNFIINRFSSPGGPETAGDAHGGAELDPDTTQLSVYNSLNYKNLPSRLALDALHSERRLKFGVAPQTNIINDVEFTSTSAKATVTFTDVSTEGETIILTDVYGRTITLTTEHDMLPYASAFFNLVLLRQTTGMKLLLASTDGAAQSLVTVINLLNQLDYLDMKAHVDASNASRVNIYMGLDTGDKGNGITITGTAISNNRATVVQFAGGISDEDLYAQNNVTASYHNVHTNYRYHPSDKNKDFPNRQADNFFVQRQIPQSDLNYSWIRNSTIETTASYFGFQDVRFTIPVRDNTSTIGFSESPRFVSASEIGFAKHSTPPTYGDHYFLVDASSSLAPRSGTATFTFSGKPNDGSTITLFDGSITKVFEIDDDLSGVTTAGNIQVDPSVTSADAAGTATQLVAKINAQSGFGITATNPSSGKVVLTTVAVEASTIVVNNSTHWNSVTSVNVPSVFGGTATFTFSGKPNDGSTITLFDGSTVKVFEIDDDLSGVTTAGNIQVDPSATSANAAGTATQLVAKINAQSDFGITATNPSSGKVDLTTVSLASTISVNDATHWNSVTSVNVPSVFGGTNTLLEFIPTDFVGLNTVVVDNVDFANNQLGYSPIPGFRPTCDLQFTSVPTDRDTFTLTDSSAVSKKFIFDTAETTVDGSNYKARGSVEFRYDSDESTLGNNVKIISSNGSTTVTKTYKFSSSTTTANTGNTDGSGRVLVGYNGLNPQVLADFRNIMVQFQNAIQHSNGHDGAIVVESIANTATESVVNLKQNVAGASGNTTISFVNDAGDTTPADQVGRYLPQDRLVAVATSFTNGDAIVIGINGAATTDVVMDRTADTIDNTAIDIFPIIRTLPGDGSQLRISQENSGGSGLTSVSNITGGSISFQAGENKFVGSPDGFNDPFLSGIAYNEKDLTTVGSQSQININYLNEELAGPKKSDAFLNYSYANAQVKGIPIMLNAILSNRGDSRGWCSWRQVRAGESKIARLQRKKNIYTSPIHTSDQLNRIALNISPATNGVLTVDQYQNTISQLIDPYEKNIQHLDRVRGSRGYSWPDNIEHRSVDATTERATVRDKFENHRFQIDDGNGNIQIETLNKVNSYLTQSVVVFGNKPLRKRTIVERNVDYPHLGGLERPRNFVEITEKLNSLSILGAARFFNIYDPQDLRYIMNIADINPDIRPPYHHTIRTDEVSYHNKTVFFQPDLHSPHRDSALYYNSRKNYDVRRSFVEPLGHMINNPQFADYKAFETKLGLIDNSEYHAISCHSLLFPRENYIHNRKVTLRPQFVFDSWKTTREKRNAASNYINSQFTQDSNIKFSSWPLDAHENFGKSKEMILGSDRPGSFSEGELMSTIGLFRSGSNNPHAVSGSAMYSRRIPETPIGYSLEIVNPSRLNTLAATEDLFPGAFVINDTPSRKKFFFIWNHMTLNQAQAFAAPNAAFPGFAAMIGNTALVNMRISDDVTDHADYDASHNNTYAVNISRAINCSVGADMIGFSTSPTRRNLGVEADNTITIKDIDRTTGTENTVSFLLTAEDGVAKINGVSQNGQFNVAKGKIIVDCSSILDATDSDGTTVFIDRHAADAFVQIFINAIDLSTTLHKLKAEVVEIKPTFRRGARRNFRQIKIFNSDTITIPSTNSYASILKSRWRSSIDPINKNKVIIQYNGTYEMNSFGGTQPLMNNGELTPGYQEAFDTPLMSLLVNEGMGDNSVLFKSFSKTHLGGSAKWELADSYGLGPFNYDSYSEFIENLRLKAKDYSVIPEYNVSKNIEVYKQYNTRDQFIDPHLDPTLETPKSLYSITGALDDFKDSSQSDYPFAFETEVDTRSKIAVQKIQASGFGSTNENKIATIKVKGLKKFLPFEGFYPVQRSLQLAKLYNEDYGQLMELNPLGSWQTALKPMFAPGIMYNTIKSGIAVDYPLFVPSADREFNRFCTRFAGGTANRVEIGSAGTWAKYLTGALAPRTNYKNNFETGSTGQQRLTGSAGYSTGNYDTLDTGSLKGISLSMWIHPYNDASNPYPNNYGPDTTFANDKIPLDSGSLFMLGDDTRYQDKTSTARGIEFRKEGDRLVFGIHHTASHVVWHTKKTGTAVNAVSDTPSSTTVTIGAAMLSMMHGSTLKLINALGVEKTYVLDGNNNGATGTTDESNRVRVQAFELDTTSSAGIEAITTQLETAINGATGHNGTISVTKTLNGFSSNLVLKQTIKGPAGNTDVTVTGMAFVANNFAGGGVSTISLATLGPEEPLFKPGSWYHVGVSYRWADNKCDFYINGHHFSSSLSSSNGVSMSSYPISTHMFGGDDHPPPPHHAHAGVSLLRDNYGNESPNATKPPPSNCSIGGHRKQYATFVDRSQAVAVSNNARPEYLKYLPMSVDIDEVSVWNKPLTAIDMVGLYGGGISGSRGPWNPEMCVRGDDSKKSLIAWYRMGDDFGYVGDIDNGVASPGAGQTKLHNTNDLVMFNRARSDNRKFRRKGYTGHNHDSNDLRIEQPTTFLTGTFTGFVDNFVTPSAVAGRTLHLNKKHQRGSGIKDVVELMSYNSFLARGRSALTGALKYPSYITGSWYNETQDTGIPRIGSASWGVNRQFPYRLGAEDSMGTFNTYPDDLGGNSRGLTNPTRDTFGTTTKGTQNFWGKGSRKHRGILRVDRLPFETIIDPKSIMSTPNFSQNEVPDTDGEILERFVIYDTEPHPSASMNAHSWTRHRTGQPFFQNPSRTNLNLVHSSSWNSPTDSIMTTSSFRVDNFAELRINKLSDRYSLAANNFFAESMNFFLLGGQSARIISSDFVQDPNIDADKNYKMRIKIETLRKNTDFPMYNKASAFGPPVDAGDVGFELARREGDTDLGDRPFRMSSWGYSPYTPPHYDGFAEIEYVLSGQELLASNTIEDVLAALRINNIALNRKTKVTGSNPAIIASGGGITNSSLGVNAAQIATSSLNKIHAMQITASFKGLDFRQGRRTIVNDIEDPNEINTRFRNAVVIESKFECPTFDFTGVSGSSPAPYGLKPNIGMWHQKPTSLDSQTQLSILGPRDFGDDRSEDLSSLLGFKLVQQGKPIAARSMTLGTLSQNKRISEAVVMVPYVDTHNGPQYFRVPEAKLYSAVINGQGYTNYQKEYRMVYQNYFGPDVNDLPEAGEIIQNMVNGMFKYVVPPEFNSIKYNGSPYVDFRKVKPYLMFFFPFEHTFDKEDLAKIWQGVSPRLGENFSQSRGYNKNASNARAPIVGKNIENFEQVELSFTLSQLEQFYLEEGAHELKSIFAFFTKPDGQYQEFDNPIGAGTVQFQERVEDAARPGRFLGAHGGEHTIIDLYEFNLGLQPDRASPQKTLASEFNNIKFRIFKVKQRAETNYERKQAIDSMRVFAEETGVVRDPVSGQLSQPKPIKSMFNVRSSDINFEFSVEKDILEYGYNWPYDYFSLVELVKIETEKHMFNNELSADGTRNAMDTFNSFDYYDPRENSE